MLFRVWDKRKKSWGTDTYYLTEYRDLFYSAVEGLSYINPNRVDLEFNTGITLADGTETFHGDIIRWKDEFRLRDNYIRHDKVFFEDGYVYSVIRPSNLFDLTENWLCEGNVWHDDIELVGNIHETELTDAMKIWIKEQG